jgi:hypothetical protein
MAGKGKKTFVAGEVLVAQDVNDFLMDQTVMNFASDAARSSAIPTPTEGMLALSKDTQEINYYNGSAFVPALPIGAWQSYAPTLSIGWANGNGTYTAAKFCQIGKTVHVVVHFVTGTTTTKGTNLQISMPVTASPTGFFIGNVRFVIAGAVTYGNIVISNAATGIIYGNGAAGAFVNQATVTAAVPGTWAASGDTIQLSITYEAA